jgi:hypothetical protein
MLRITPRYEALGDFEKLDTKSILNSECTYFPFQQLTMIDDANVLKDWTPM